MLTLALVMPQTIAHQTQEMVVALQSLVLVRRCRREVATIERAIAGFPAA
jgi:hypothetical protein